ncbi:hypothetical protein KQ880_15670, partial [Listeria monocytogenes]|nr:hypothetical protein [Listeria monocytogenes]
MAAGTNPDSSLGEKCEELDCSPANPGKLRRDHRDHAADGRYCVREDVDGGKGRLPCPGRR